MLCLNNNICDVFSILSLFADNFAAETGIGNAGSITAVGSNNHARNSHADYLSCYISETDSAVQAELSADGEDQPCNNVTQHEPCEESGQQDEKGKYQEGICFIS